MITASRDTEEDSRADYAFVLLESSGYSDAEQQIILEQINDSSADEIEAIIRDLLMNQVDRWNSYRQKDISYRLYRHGC